MIPLGKSYTILTIFGICLFPQLSIRLGKYSSAEHQAHGKSVAEKKHLSFRCFPCFTTLAFTFHEILSGSGSGILSSHGRHEIISL